MSMSVSFKKATNKTNIKHNNRDFTEKQKAQNSHIDFSKSDENKILVQKDLRELYEREFSEPLKNYNDKQKRNDRKIDDYYQHIKDSKKTSLQQEIGNIYQGLKAFVKENMADLKGFKALFKSMTHDISQNAPRGEFSHLTRNDREINRTRDRSR